MDNQSFTTTFQVDQSPKDVFNAISNVRGWWSEEIEGRTDQLNEEFLYHYRDVHRCKIKIVEFTPDKKIAWLVMENNFNFTKDKTEWIGTKITFNIIENDGKTLLQFTHQGLVPEYECYGACNEGWSNYINVSLYNLIITGKGQPNATEKPRTKSEKKFDSVKR